MSIPLDQRNKRSIMMRLKAPLEGFTQNALAKTIETKSLGNNPMWVYMEENRFFRTKRI